MGDVLSKSSARFARDNWNYREQTSVVLRCTYSADSGKMERVPDLVNQRTRTSPPAESPKVASRRRRPQRLYIPCSATPLREGLPVVARPLTASATGPVQRRCRLANCAAPLRRASNRSP